MGDLTIKLKLEKEMKDCQTNSLSPFSKLYLMVVSERTWSPTTHSLSNTLGIACQVLCVGDSKVLERVMVVGRPVRMLTHGLTRLLKVESFLFPFQPLVSCGRPGCEHIAHLVSTITLILAKDLLI